MISYLKVRSLALVNEAELEPSEGLNALTGETGAGKSLLIDSLQFLSGSRASSEMVRSGTDRMIVEAVAFGGLGVIPVLEELAIEHDATDGEIELVIRRELNASGRGRASINGTTLTARDLARVMELIIEIHGQHQSVSRIGGQTWREMLDTWAGHDELLEAGARAHEHWREVSVELTELRSAASDRLQRVETLRYQIEELSSAAIEDGEAGELRDERSVLANSEELAEVLSNATELIVESDDSATSLVGRVSSSMERLARKVESLQPIVSELEEVLIRLDEIGRSVTSIGSDVRHDPERLDSVETRLALIERLERKYGRDADSLPALLTELENELADLEDFDASLTRIEKREAEAFEKFRDHAQQLSAGRKKAATALASAIESELADLAMENARIRFEISTRPSSSSRLEISGEKIGFSPAGYDRVTLLSSTNPGEPFRDLTRIASGGELSRLQLAIASALSSAPHAAGASTLVFDEIDAGVSGRIADVVGRKLQKLSESAQVVCVTHLPQIAGLAATQFHVSKTSSEDQTSTAVRKLGDEERIERIAEMLAGRDVTPEAIANARALIESAKAASPS